MTLAFPTKSALRDIHSERREVDVRARSRGAPTSAICGDFDPGRALLASDEARRSVVQRGTCASRATLSSGSCRGQPVGSTHRTMPQQGCSILAPRSVLRIRSKRTAFRAATRTHSSDRHVPGWRVEGRPRSVQRPHHATSRGAIRVRGVLRIRASPTGGRRRRRACTQTDRSGLLVQGTSLWCAPLSTIAPRRHLHPVTGVARTRRSPTGPVHDATRAHRPTRARPACARERTRSCARPSIRATRSLSALRQRGSARTRWSDERRAATVTCAAAPRAKRARSSGDRFVRARRAPGRRCPSSDKVSDARARDPSLFRLAAPTRSNGAGTGENNTATTSSSRASHRGSRARFLGRGSRRRPGLQWVGLDFNDPSAERLPVPLGKPQTPLLTSVTIWCYREPSSIRVSSSSGRDPHLVQPGRESCSPTGPSCSAHGCYSADDSARYSARM